MLIAKKIKQNKFKTFFIVLVTVSVMYLYTDAIDVFIKTNIEKEEIFYISTAINYSEIMKSSTRGRVKRLVKSGTVQRLPIKLDNIIFFSHIFANVYHPDYLFQQKQHSHRSIFSTVNFPVFTPKSWHNVMTNNIKIKISEPTKEIYTWEAIASGELIRIVDVLGHLIRFKNDYIPLFLTKGSKKQLSEYLPRLRAIAVYTKENLEVSYDELEKHDLKYLKMMEQELLEINTLIKKQE